jgi:hypothetical protein
MNGPTLITAAIFVSIIFLDLFRFEYKQVPVHAVLGFFSILLMSALSEMSSQYLAWILLLIPFIILGVGIYLYESKIRHSPPYPVAPIQTQQPRHQPAPYYI